MTVSVHATLIIGVVLLVGVLHLARYAGEEILAFVIWSRSFWRRLKKGS